EIDIRACCKDVVIFVEVKSGNGKRILPSERVDREKFEKIIKVAEYYLEHRLKDKIYNKVQIDVVEVVGSAIKHYEDIGWDFS
ncbi:MAG: YraN family protein, partial [Fervidobacterium sp.]